MKTSRWQKIISIMISFAIVFNITMVPVFAEGEDVTAEPAQEEETAESSQEEGEEAQPEETTDEETPEEGQDAATEPEAEEPEAGAEDESEEAKPEEHVGGEGKYVTDVYIAYGKTEEDAKKWLRKNGWEPLNGNADFNAGKASFFDNNKLQDQNVAAVMGIKRTDDPVGALTDMAIMNMKGGYSFPDYEALVKEKKTEINEFIKTFIPVLEEYRKNYKGKGNAAGKKRAELAHNLLNRFYDGGEDEPYAVNDTGKPLGDLFLSKVMQEDGGKDSGDLQQILLESSGAAVITIETCLALAADAEETTWVERLEGLSGDELSKNLGEYVPEAKGQDVAPSAVNQFLKQHFGDQAKILAGQWSGIHEKMLMFEEYNEKNDLWQHDGEKDEAYGKRLEQYFNNLEKEAGNEMTDEQKDYFKAAQLYTGLYEIPYEGEWGETLGDFFNPAEDDSYAEDINSFLPIAASLSKGQRSALELVSLETLILIGMGTEESVGEIFTESEELMGDAEEISVYSGINRGIYRGGVALTSAALMEKNQNGADPFADMWSISGIYNITTYAVAITGIIAMGVGFGISRSVAGPLGELSEKIGVAERGVYRNQGLYNQTVALDQAVKNNFEGDYSKIMGVGQGDKAKLAEELDGYSQQIKKYQDDLEKLNREAAPYQRISNIGRIVMGIGGALLVGAAVAKGYQMYRYYNKTFTQIPMYIVDEADIVSYEKDEEGNETKLINFDQFVYYSAVECNRQEVGELGDWQDGVSDYASWGCGNAADLNADSGQQWLALYKVASEKKGYPILADSLTLQYGSDKMPKGCSKALHMFTYENAADIGDTAYAYNNDKNGIYFFWDVDEKADAKEAASAFTGGTAAIAGGAAVLIVAVIAAVVMKKKRKEA